MGKILLQNLKKGARDVTHWIQSPGPLKIKEKRNKLLKLEYRRYGEDWLQMSTWYLKLFLKDSTQDWTHGLPTELPPPALFKTFYSWEKISPITELLELVSTCNPPASDSQNARITGMCYYIYILRWKIPEPTEQKKVRRLEKRLKTLKISKSTRLTRD